MPPGALLSDTRKIVMTKLAAYTKQRTPAERKTTSSITQWGKGKQFTQSAWATFDGVANSRGGGASGCLTFSKYGRLVTMAARLKVRFSN